MIPELGHFAPILAFLVALIQGVVPLVGAHQYRTPLIAVARPAALAQFAFMALSFACLTWAFVANDFSVEYVAQHSNTRLPIHYRITGVWGSHEGSLLLWGLILSGWTLAVAAFSRTLPDIFIARVLGVLGLVSGGFMSFILFTSNPFTRLLPAVAEGQDLNPLLQDPGMIIHPPLLYMGYVGFSVAFAFAIAALISGRLDAAWARWSRPWTSVAWVFLTLGIAVGSGWAYYELGWGGWWFWDPVENASFMPWLVGTALIHSLAVTEKRGAFRSWTVLLAIAAFSLSLLGTFLVRSGVLTSVHAFATDPRRGMYILGLLVLVIGISLMLFAWRAPRLAGGGKFALVSRESVLLANNVLLSVVATSVLLGTLYPLFLDALNLGKISVGPPYFESVFLPLMVPVVVLMALGPLLRWKGHDVAAITAKLAPWLIGSIALGVAGAWLAGVMSWRMIVGMTLAAWVLIVNAVLLIERLRERPGAAAGARLRGITRAWWGMWIAHVGIGVFIIGVAMVNGTQSNLDVKMRVGDTATLAGYDFELTAITDAPGPNYAAAQGTLKVTREGKAVAELTPEKRIYLARQMPMTEASLDIGLFGDIYASMGEQIDDTTWIVRLYYKPFISWIWFGCLLMAFGGGLAAADRRYRRLAARTAPDAGAPQTA